MRAILWRSGRDAGVHRPWTVNACASAPAGMGQPPPEPAGHPASTSVVGSYELQRVGGQRGV